MLLNLYHHRKVEKCNIVYQYLRLAVFIKHNIKLVNYTYSYYDYRNILTFLNFLLIHFYKKSKKQMVIG